MYEVTGDVEKPFYQFNIFSQKNEQENKNEIVFTLVFKATQIQLPLKPHTYNVVPLSFASVMIAQLGHV